MKGPEGEVIPPRVIDKPPTAELREDQKDEDSLPPYADLDVMLEMLIDKDASVADVVALGYDRETVKKIERLIYLSEYKRFQSAPGTRLTERAFLARPPLSHREPLAGRDGKLTETAPDFAVAERKRGDRTESILSQEGGPGARKRAPEGAPAVTQMSLASVDAHRFHVVLTRHHEGKLAVVD